MITLTGLLLGLINIGLVAAVLLFVGAVVAMMMGWLGVALDGRVQRLYIIVVVLVVLYMTVALLLGMPTLHLIR